MKRLLKIVLIVFLSIASLFALGIWIISYHFKAETVAFVIESINRNITTRINVQSVDFSVIRKFPNAAVEFKHVVIFPSNDFDTLSFEPSRSRQLLNAETVFVEINLISLLRGDNRITSIEVQNGNLNILTDKNGKHNFIFWKTDEKNEESSPIELQNVTLRHVDVYYGQDNTTLSLFAERAFLSGKFASKQYTMTADWDGIVHLFSMFDDIYIRDKTLELSGKLNVDDNFFNIKHCEASIAKIDLSISGGFSIDSNNDVDFDLFLEGKNIDYVALVSALPESYAEKLNDYTAKGIINFSASINGNAPHIEAQFGMKQGAITHRKSHLKLTGLSFTGSFTNGEKNRRATTSLKISSFGFKFGDGTLRGNFSLQNFAKPQISFKIIGNTDLDQLYRFIPDKHILSAGGQINCDMSVNTRLKKLSVDNTDDIEQLTLQGTIKFDNASIHLREPAYHFNTINGSLLFGNRISTDDLSLKLNGNDFKIGGYVEQLTPYLLNRCKTIYLKANVTSLYLNVDSLLMTDGLASAPPVHTSTQMSEKPLNLPDNIIFDTNIEAQKIKYQDFEVERLKAHLVYNPQTLDIKSVNFSAMSGQLTGKGAIAIDKTGNIRVLGETTLSQVDVKQLFSTFDNFGQEQLRAEHIKGKLSGELDFAVGWDNKMQLRQKEMLVAANMELDGGELVNFEPLNSLSKFVALEELQNIRFSKLNTQISIKNNILSFPHTDVRTSAFDISCNGTHSFENNYTYHVKILLSELLAAKARKAKRENIENEYVEEGEKRAALHLKIAGQGDDFKISYDKQSAKASVAENIRNEKQTLKNILKEEFGFFKKDTTLVKTQKPPDKSGQLQFTFDEE